MGYQGSALSILGGLPQLLMQRRWTEAWVTAKPVIWWPQTIINSTALFFMCMLLVNLPILENIADVLTKPLVGVGFFQLGIMEVAISVSLCLCVGATSDLLDFGGFPQLWPNPRFPKPAKDAGAGALERWDFERYRAERNWWMALTGLVLWILFWAAKRRIHRLRTEVSQVNAPPSAVLGSSNQSDAPVASIIANNQQHPQAPVQQPQAQPLQPHQHQWELIADVAPSLTPITGVMRLDIVSLEESTRPLLQTMPALQTSVQASINFARDKLHLGGADPHGLTEDMIAAINLYTQQVMYEDLNSKLRAESRNCLKPYFLYLRLLLAALDKLPSKEGTFFRGIRADLSQSYYTDRRFFWWAFTSCTVDGDALKGDDGFLGEYGSRSLFTVTSKHGKDIAAYSAFQAEAEVLLLPGFQYKVENRMDVHGSSGMVLYLIKEQDAERAIH